MFRMKSIVPAFALVAAATMATTACSSPPANHMTEKEVRSIVEDYIRNNPAVILDSVNAHLRAQQAASQAGADAAIAQNVNQILSDKGYPISGNPKGAVEIAYFFDYNCGYCKRMQPVLEAVVAKNPDVKIIYREFPILAPSSELAAKVALAVWEKAPKSYDTFHSALKKHKGQLDEAVIRQIVTDNVTGADAGSIFKHALEGKSGDAIAKQIADNRALAKKISIQGTPFIYLKGTPFRGAVDADAIQKAIDAVRASNKK